VIDLQRVVALVGSLQLNTSTFLLSTTSCTRYRVNLHRLVQWFEMTMSRSRAIARMSG